MDSASEIFQPACSDGQFPSEHAKNGDHFIIDDLLDYPNDDEDPADGGVDAAMTGTSADSTVTASCNSTAQPHSHPSDVGGVPRCSDGCHFSGEICDPYDDFADLEWLSNFVEESFSTTEDFQKLQPIQGYTKARTAPLLQPETASSGPTLRPEKPVPAKARSKRSRAAPGNWTSRLLVVSPAPPAMSSSSESDGTAKKAAVMKKKEVTDSGGEGRRCLHCASDKTPQWRTGPMGPKTLCNACGVRYKSGRLVPEYRPASSPTFVLTKHSNSHRKVLELRRQKEMARSQQQLQPPPPYLHHHHHHQNMINLDVSNGDDYLIHQHNGPDFRQLI